MVITPGRSHGATKDNTEFDANGRMHRCFRRWINPLFKEKTSEEPSNSNVSKDKNNVEEIDSLRQQIEELRDIITKKNP